MNSESLREKYIQYAKDWGTAIVQGDRKSANKIHRLLNKTISVIKQDEPECRLFLSDLIHHPEPSVRLVASVDSLYLGINLKESEYTLDSLASNPEFKVLRLMALASLDVWRKQAKIS